jgi:hypothetical protein
VGEPEVEAVEQPGEFFAQHPWANQISESLGARDLERAVATMQRLSSLLQSSGAATE